MLHLSVIIPTCNKRDDLKHCLEAVLAQHFDGSFEVLVCDDGSDDGTTEMLDAWSRREPRLRYLRQQRRGPAAARNLGIRNARAPLVAMTDDDTIPQPGWLARLCAAAGRPGVAGVEGRVAPDRPIGPAETAPVNESGGVYLTCNILYRRDVLLDIGGFDERFPYAAFEDCDLAARARRHGKIAWEPGAVVLHPPRPVAWSGVVRRLRHWIWAMVVAKRYGYVGWPRFPARRPKARVLWNALVKLPAGRLLAALRAMASHPRQALRAACWALAEPLAAAFRVLPEVLAFDLESAALHLDYVNHTGTRPRVGVVVVHYRQPDLLAQCIESFRTLDYPDLRVIIVDSAADPESAAALRRIPGVEWILCRDNVGYAAGNNLGIARAMDLGCEYVLLANADTECIAPDFLSRMVRFLQLNPRVAVAGPRVYLKHRGQVQNTILRYPSLFRQLVDWFGCRLFPDRYERSGEVVRAVEMLNGVCVLLRAAAVREVGAFDPNFFMYIEDADLGLRFRKAGWQVAYVPFDSIVHHQKETGYELEGQVSLLLRRNAVYFLRKHHRRFQAWGLAGANLLLALVRACVATTPLQFRRRISFFQALCREFWTVLRPLESRR